MKWVGGFGINLQVQMAGLEHADLAQPLCLG
jgi:hypothetical protein